MWRSYWLIQAQRMLLYLSPHGLMLKLFMFLLKTFLLDEHSIKVVMLHSGNFWYLSAHIATRSTLIGWSSYQRLLLIPQWRQFTESNAGMRLQSSLSIKSLRVGSLINLIHSMIIHFATTPIVPYAEIYGNEFLMMKS